MRPSVRLSTIYSSKKEKALRLRAKGWSYKEIAQTLTVSKSTAYYWTRRVKLSKTAQARIEKKIKESLKKGLIAYNKVYSKIRSQEAAKIREGYKEKASRDIKNLSKKDLKLIGAALYWAEGDNKNRNNFSFSNSNPFIIKTIMEFLRKVCKIPDEKIKAKMHLYPQINPRKAILFWSKITNLPKTQFTKPQFQISKASKRKRNPNTLPYGTLHLEVYNTKFLWTVRGWAEGIIKNLMRE